jgi:hypothetical protein
MVCEGCFEECIDIVCYLLRCKHTYCTPCLSRMSLCSINDIGLMPPKCCNVAVPERVIKDVLTKEDYTKYCDRLEKKKIRCVNCESAFEEDQISEGKVLQCLECEEFQCKLCKQSFGRLESKICFCIDESEEEILQLIEENEWTRCRNCGHGIILWEGCNHMICICGYQYCYKCKFPWLKCVCNSSFPTRLRNVSNSECTEVDDDDDALDSTDRRYTSEEEEFDV